MARAVSVAAVLFAGALFVRSLSACSPFGGASAFACATDEECRNAGVPDGVCEPTGACSFVDSTCPSGRRYGDLAGGGLANVCVGGEPGEAGIDAPDAPKPEAGEECFGSAGALVTPCFATLPSETVNLAGAIDTSTSPLCSTVVSNTTACVIAGNAIVVGDVQVTGAKPLVLVAVTTIQVDGTLDAASHRIGGKLGPAANDAGCDAGTPPTTVANAGGGGAGGSFGAKGGDGGGGTNGATGGQAGNALAAALHGGCAGQAGKDGSVMNTGGAGGAGGGAVVLIARGSITIAATGVVNASGAGASNGVTGLAGGGGGGSGGLIGFDAPTVTNGGVVFANGGSGAEGSGNAGAGQPGSDPIGVAAATPLAPGSGNGGDGGNGGAAPTDTGSPGLQSTDGGGGGGGVGIIKVLPTPALGGQVSPAAS